MIHSLFPCRDGFGPKMLVGVDFSPQKACRVPPVKLAAPKMPSKLRNKKSQVGCLL